jgi:sigma-B regulation protein RsbU (phosphoserine phosphatase)
VIDPQDAYPVVPGGAMIDIMLGTIFLFVGMAACGIAVLRRRGASRPLVWFGLFIGMFGLRMLAEVTSLLRLVPGSPWPDRVVTAVDYLLVIPALLFWAEVSAGILQRAFQWLTVLATSVAVLGLGWFAISGSPETFLRVNSLLAICTMVVIGILVLVPKVTRKYLTIRSQALRIAMPLVAFIGVYVNVRWYFGVPPAHFIEPVSFAIWVSAIGYEAAKRTFDNERRLFSIDSELETARLIQSSILPDYVPSVTGLRIAATYRPMSAVAGDFYQFLEVDEHRMGILVADVSGHGVPAALIASMIKVAMQSAVSSASSPSQVLGHLNRILTPELKGSLTSAAYLWLDTEQGYARYSAAGHPPLLHWKASEGHLRPVDCNGLLFGVASSWLYPECELRLDCGDRLLLYTDGLIEPENARGESFGDRELGHAVEASQALVAQDLADRLLGALRKWQPRSVAQQDDITLLVIDIVQPDNEVTLQGLSAQPSFLSRQNL